MQFRDHSGFPENWLLEKIAPNGDVADGCHPREAEALQAFLRGDTTPEEAARAITEPLETATDPNEDFPRLWSFMIDALIELPARHIDPLIALLRAIEHLPEPNFPLAEESKRPGGKVWKGLGGFGHLLSDMDRAGSWRYEVKDMDASDFEILRNDHIRKAEIEAHLVNEGIAGIHIDWGYEVVAGALESSNAILEFDIPAATAWLSICGLWFRKGAEQKYKSWGLQQRNKKSKVVPSKDMWTSMQVGEMNLKRWEYWKSRLEALQDEAGSVRNAAKQGHKAMLNVERDSYC